jgi:hypothetical protein
VEHFQLKGIHSRTVVDAVEEAHEKNLGVTLATIAGLGLALLRLLAHLDDHEVRHHVAFVLVQAGVHLAIVELLAASAN